MAEPQPNSEFAALLSNAGCSDTGGVSMLANPALPTASAKLADLRARYPAAFPRHSRDMSAQEFRAAVKEATRYRPEPVQVIEKHASQMSEREYTAALRQFGVYRRQRS